ncbi:MAG: hypothetical protein JJT89_02090 [Nitriliruptoraceae bacterium]|nr:hypothetical protein [Nitriliruptoraceae bacterium]
MDLIARSLHRFRTSEAGEGVISTAIAVLIMAVIGAAMFLAFSGIFDDSTETVRQNLEQITNE